MSLLHFCVNDSLEIIEIKSFSVEKYKLLQRILEMKEKLFCEEKHVIIFNYNIQNFMMILLIDFILLKLEALTENLCF